VNDNDKENDKVKEEVIQQNRQMQPTKPASISFFFLLSLLEKKKKKKKQPLPDLYKKAV